MSKEFRLFHGVDDCDDKWQLRPGRGGGRLFVEVKQSQARAGEVKSTFHNFGAERFLRLVAAMLAAGVQTFGPSFLPSASRAAGKILEADDE